MILVTGGNGMVAHALKKVLPKGPHLTTYLTRDMCDLSRQEECEQYFDKTRPEAVVHLAARVGGILSNVRSPYDYFYDNVIINTNVIHCCVKFSVKYLISTSSACSYPAKTDHYPMAEDQVHSGPPEETNFYYAYAKRMMQVHQSAARKQHDLNCCVLYVSNLYGERDNFSGKGSHVIPALMSKFHEAKTKKISDKIMLKGTPDGLRQFTFTDDLANVISECIDRRIIGDYNFGSPGNISIGDLVGTLKEVVGCNNDIGFDQQLGGVHRKDVDTSALIKRLGFDNFVDLKTGLQRTYKWYLENQ